MWLITLLLIAIPVLCQAEPKKKYDPAEFYLREIATEKTLPLPDCSGLPTGSDHLCKTIRTAQEQVRSSVLSVYKDKAQMLREFVIIAQDPVTEEFHEILLDMPVSPRGDFQPRVKTEHDPPYRVERVSGSSFIKMRFVIYAGDTRLYAYAAKYLDIPTGMNTSSLEKVRAAAEPLVYLYADEHTSNSDLARKGFEFVRTALMPAHLQVRTIPSRAVPGKSIGDIISPAVLLDFLVAEQTDHDQFFGGKDWKAYDEGIDDPFEQEAIRTVFVNFFINGLDAYRYICSKEKACGPYQFTNRARVVEGKRYLGTYDMVRFAYPQANLDPDFRRGTHGFTNSAKAALLLMDFELTHGAKRVREDFVREPELGILYAGAAYNGGAMQAKRLAEFFDRYERKGKVQLTLATLPWSSLLLATQQQKLLFRETLGYIRKLSILRKLHVSRYDALSTPRISARRFLLCKRKSGGGFPSLAGVAGSVDYFFVKSSSTTFWGASLCVGAGEVSNTSPVPVQVSHSRLKSLKKREITHAPLQVGHVFHCPFIPHPLQVVWNLFAPGHFVPEAEHEASVSRKYLGVFEKTPDAADIDFFAVVAHARELVVAVDLREEAAVDMAFVHLEDVSQMDDVAASRLEPRLLAEFAARSLKRRFAGLDVSARQFPPRVGAPLAHEHGGMVQPESSHARAEDND
jgi:hypothetical protein